VSGSDAAKSGSQRHILIVNLHRALDRELIFAAGFALVAVAISLAPTSLRDSLLWRADVSPLEFWRWVSAHFVHLSPLHLTLNLAALRVLVLIFRQWRFTDRAHSTCVDWLLPAGLSMVTVDLALAARLGEIAWYGGLSGVLHGVFAWLSLLHLAPPASLGLRSLAVLLWLGGLIKSIHDLTVPVGAMGWLGVPLATPAHLAGYVGGSLAGVVVLRRLR
jgi:rhomboid family GlyGly-CTERM serine protease